LKDYGKKVKWMMHFYYLYFVAYIVGGNISIVTRFDIYTALTNRKNHEKQIKNSSRDRVSETYAGSENSKCCISKSYIEDRYPDNFFK